MFCFLGATWENCAVPNKHYEPELTVTREEEGQAEPGAAVWRQYYYAAGQRVAVRDGQGSGTTGLSFLLGDHLGSTHVTTDASGTKLAELRYKPWGDVRYAEGSTPTSFRFTGQREEADLGIYYYGARWYDPYLNHMIQPDTIIPDLYNPQNWNRYSYVNYNPINRTDPTGHAVCFDSDCNVVVHPTTGGLHSRGGSLATAAWSIVKELGGVNDVEAMARIIEVGANKYQNKWDSRLLTELTYVFNGVAMHGPGTLIASVLADGCAGVGRDPGDCGGSLYSFRDAGFHEDFRDLNNQPYHVWGYVAETAKPGSILGYLGQTSAAVGNYVHEIVQSGLSPIFPSLGGGTSWQDHVLAVEGGEIGMLITNQTISPQELADVIRTRLGSQGTGSDGWFQRLTDTYGPLAGQH